MPRTSKPKAPRKQRPQKPYCMVWRPDTDPERLHSMVYDALDPASAARIFAQRNASDADEDEWPIAFYVEPVRPTADDYESCGDIVVVSVMREMVPVYVADKPLPLKMKPASHLIMDGRPVCRDPRLSSDVSRWPDGQTATFARYNQLADVLEAITCEGCKRRAGQVLAALRSIGAVT